MIPRELDTLIVFSCDQNYFPLAKGLVLSILEPEGLPGMFGLACIDIGCSPDALAWFASHEVKVCPPDPLIMGALADPQLRYRRSQTCRPFLPQLFPGVKTLIWIDCDAWVQDRSIFQQIRAVLRANGEKLLIAPECHYSYSWVNDNGAERRREMYSYYEPTYGPEVAGRMCERLTLNSGLFAMSADNALWNEWAWEIGRLHLEDDSRYPPIVRHMGEQIALNVIAYRSTRVMLLDPLYNYISLWMPPIRDSSGLVKVALPPHATIGVIHLAGGWTAFGEMYLRNRLLYKSGSYLTESDLNILTSNPERVSGFR